MEVSASVKYKEKGNLWEIDSNLIGCLGRTQVIKIILQNCGSKLLGAINKFQNLTNCSLESNNYSLSA